MAEGGAQRENPQQERCWHIPSRHLLLRINNRAGPIDSAGRNEEAQVVEVEMRREMEMEMAMDMDLQGVEIIKCT